ncbi:MAG: hypothetical protein ACRCVN_00600 [Spirochaetia bacterium]
MKETESNKSPTIKRSRSGRNRWSSRRSKNNDRKRREGPSLTITRPGRQKPLVLGRSAYRPEKKSPRIAYQPVCPICEKKILSSSSIVENPGTGDPSHFECVLQSLKNNHPLEKDQRLAYLGSGVFAVIEQEHPGRKNSPFKIIEYVHNGQKPSETPWKADISITPRYVIHVEKTTLQMKEEMAELEKMSIKPTENSDFLMLEQDN